MRVVRGGYDMTQPWPESLYREAVIILNAEAGYKVTAEEVDEEAEKRRRAMPTTGFVAGRDLNFWSKYINAGVFDSEAVLDRHLLTEEQLPEKLAEMRALGWLDESVFDTAPLVVLDSVSDSTQSEQDSPDSESVSDEAEANADA